MKLLDELRTSNMIVGVKQLRKALNAGKVSKVFVARDADPALTDPLVQSCRERCISVVFVPSMKQLGEACSISVPAAAAAIL